jgi:hypothetical protein
MFKKCRLGLDIDDKPTAKKMLRIFRILKIKGFYRLSSSKRGYHFSLIVSKHTKQESLIIRYIFNDCYGRWIGDLRRLKNGISHFDILFDKKKNKKSGCWRKI